MNFTFWCNYSDESSGIDTYLAALSLCQFGMSALENSSDLVKTLEEMVHLGILENFQPKQEIAVAVDALLVFQEQAIVSEILCFFFLIYLLIMLLQLSHSPPQLHSILPTPSLPHSLPIVHVHGSYL